MQGRSSLLTCTPSGLYCAQADVYIDPWRPVKRALITHAHSDHARPGSDYYLAHHRSLGVLKQRLGVETNQLQGIEYGERVSIAGVEFSFHPAGHVPGSAQISVSLGGERWVVSGDYKLEVDGVSTPFESVRCDTFISESTFGLPIFAWRPQSEVFSEIHRWWQQNRSEGIISVLSAYSLGKAQRVLANLDKTIGPIYVHPSIMRVCEVLEFSLDGLRCEPLTELSRAQSPLVVVPPAVLNSSWMRSCHPCRTASVSGWMAIRGMKRRRGVDRGFVLSDHADFNGLHQAISATGASTVYLTHGYTAAFARWLSERYPSLCVRELEIERGRQDQEE